MNKEMFYIDQVNLRKEYLMERKKVVPKKEYDKEVDRRYRAIDRAKKSNSLTKATYENWELIRKRSGETYSQSVRRLINEKAKQLTQPRRRINKRMRMEELEGTEKD
jgi:hypothetical protein